MRLIGYKDGFDHAIIDHAESYRDIGDIVGGFFREDGKIVLHVKKHTSGLGREQSNAVYVIPIGKLPETLDDAMCERELEDLRGENLFYITKQNIE